MGSESQQMTAEQRRRLEELEAAREAEYLAQVARQREELGAVAEDGYVLRRVAREMAAIEEAQRHEQEEELARSGGGTPTNPYLLLLLGLAIGAAVLVLSALSGRGGER